ELFNSLKMENVTSGDIAYKIAPRINAAGRMGDAFRAFELLTSTDRVKIRKIVSEIEDDNGKRKALCDEMYDEAVGDLAFEDMVNSRAIVLSHPDWEKGITGIVAARIANEFKRPTFILVRSGETYKGTCRSVDGINIHELLSYCRDYLVEFGGHSQAAGFSILPENIEPFKVKANEFLSDYADEYFLPKVCYDVEIEEHEATYNFVSALELLEPFGNGNPKPLFKMVIENAKVSPCKNNQNHISVILNGGMQFFAFNYSRLSYQLISQGKKEIVTELQLSNFGGRSVKGMIKTVAPENLYINDSVARGYNYSLLRYAPTKKAKYSHIKWEELGDFMDKLYGNLFVAFSRNTYEKFINSFGKPLFNEYIYATNINNYSRIIVAPEFTDNLLLSNFENIVFLDAPLNEGIISYINSQTKANVYLCGEVENSYDLSVEREVFAKYFELIKRNQKTNYSNILSYFNYLNKDGDLSLNQLNFCLSVFEELKFISITRMPFSVSVNTGVRADLASSTIYKTVERGVK
ncbi:MAG: single-stranded-DNA-specific exonuclease C-terminal domain-containing protein, partial [Clostridia bacterium]|nr:single-stranded-DNA-specific exonuclease C-terminal domain-containing protein [Clostridia bacterium]